jgi:hypothetical protein
VHVDGDEIELEAEHLDGDGAWHDKLARELRCVPRRGAGDTRSGGAPAGARVHYGAPERPYTRGEGARHVAPSIGLGAAWRRAEACGSVNGPLSWFSPFQNCETPSS